MFSETFIFPHWYQITNRAYPRKGMKSLFSYVWLGSYVWCS